MKIRALAVVFVLFVVAGTTARAADTAAAEYARHLKALGDLSVAVAQAMPADKYGFKPHPESMNFGELMNHIATTNYQFCAGAATPKRRLSSLLRTRTASFGFSGIRFSTARA